MEIGLKYIQHIEELTPTEYERYDFKHDYLEAIGQVKQPTRLDCPKPVDYQCATISSEQISYKQLRFYNYLETIAPDKYYKDRWKLINSYHKLLAKIGRDKHMRLNDENKQLLEDLCGDK